SKLDTDGNLVWARAMGGAGEDSGGAIAIDGSGNVFTTGGFEQTVDFDPGPGSFNLTSVNFSDIFVSKLDNAGNFVWARSMGGFTSDLGQGIAVDASGSVYTTGVEGAIIFVSKLSNAGSFIWAGSIGGVNDNDGLGIALDGSDDIYTTGFFDGT